jgi:hypothetical protein
MRQVCEIAAVTGIDPVTVATLDDDWRATLIDVVNDLMEKGVKF